MSNVRKLADKVTLILGASSGMGEATARRFAGEGARVILSARRRERLEALAAELAESGAEVLSRAADVEDPASVEALVEAALGRFSRLDVLVYAVGTNIPRRSLRELTTEAWESLLRINLTGAFTCTRAVLPAMRRQGSGLLIYISSVAVRVPDTSGAAYQASKHGLVGLAQATFREEKENGVRTSVIFPGLTDTPLVLKRPAPTPPDVLAQALQPEDVAEACLFVASLPARAVVPELVILPAGLA